MRFHSQVTASSIPHGAPMSLPAKSAVLLLWFVFLANAQSAPNPIPLELNKPIEKELSGGQSHSYAITLATGQYAHVVVDQHGIDVIVSFRRLDGGKIVEVDTPSDDRGPEPISLVADTGGTYLLQVTAPSGTG